MYVCFYVQIFIYAYLFIIWYYIYLEKPAKFSECIYQGKAATFELGP